MTYESEQGLFDKKLMLYSILDGLKTGSTLSGIYHIALGCVNEKPAQIGVGLTALMLAYGLSKTQEAQMPSEEKK